MNTEALVELISKEVLKQLSTEGSYNRALDTRESILVIGGDSNREKLIRTLRNYKLSFMFEQEQPHLDDYDHLLLAEMSSKLLADSALGLENCLEGSLLMEALMSGKSVYLLEEGIAYRRYTSTAKSALLKLFQQKESELLSYGVKLVQLNNLKQQLSDKSDCCDRVSTMTAHEEKKNDKPSNDGSYQEGVFSIHTRVVRECDFLNGMEQGYRHFSVIDGALLTPLAKDCVRLQELQVGVNG